jgi:hypothetical protein
MGIDLYGSYKLQLLSNTAGVNESNQVSALGGGIDLRAGFIVLGVQLLSNASEIELTGGSTSNVDFNSVGIRLGFELVPQEGKTMSSLLVGASMHIGTATVGSNSAAVNQYAAFLQFGLDVIGALK